MRLISLILLFLLSGTVSAQKVEWYTTTQTSPWVKQKVKPERATTGAEIVLDPTQRLQLITGIGGCFNEMGWDALNALSAKIVKLFFKLSSAKMELALTIAVFRWGPMTLP